eukprot:scaffold6_cov330-Pavlova_lutheri.AAC.18
MQWCVPESRGEPSYMCDHPGLGNSTGMSRTDGMKSKRWVQRKSRREHSYSSATNAKLGTRVMGKGSSPCSSTQLSANS